MKVHFCFLNMATLAQKLSKRMQYRTNVTTDTASCVVSRAILEFSRA